MSDETLTYMVPDWDAKFETHESRKLKRLTWIAMNIDTDLYAELTNHPNGAAHLGAWLAIVMTAAKSKTRGTLVRANGQPHTADTLALITRLPAAVFEEALPRLLELGLLAQSPAVPGESTGMTGKSPATVHDKTEKTGPNTTQPNTTPQHTTQPAPARGISADERLKFLENRWRDCEDVTDRRKYRQEYQDACTRSQAA